MRPPPTDTMGFDNLAAVQNAAPKSLSRVTLSVRR
jgi:hypothetical protein